MSTTNGRVVTMLGDAHLQEDASIIVNVLRRARVNETPCENLVSTQVCNLFSDLPAVPYVKRIEG